MGDGSSVNIVAFEEQGASREEDEIKEVFEMSSDKVDEVPLKKDFRKKVTFLSEQSANMNDSPKNRRESIQSVVYVKRPKIPQEPAKVLCKHGKRKLTKKELKTYNQQSILYGQDLLLDQIEAENEFMEQEE